VEQGYAEQGLDKVADNFLKEIAAGKEPPWCINHLFVYGTFMRGESRNHILKSTDVIEFAELATVTGELYDTGKGIPPWPRPPGLEMGLQYRGKCSC